MPGRDSTRDVRVGLFCWGMVGEVDSNSSLCMRKKQRFHFHCFLCTCSFVQMHAGGSCIMIVIMFHECQALLPDAGALVDTLPYIL